MATEF